MSSPGPSSTNDQLTNLALDALAGGVVLIAALRVAGSIAAWLSGLPEPTGGFAAGLQVFTTPLHPGTALGAPGLSPVLYWIVAAVLIIAPTLLIGWGVLRWRSRRHRPVDVHRIAGIATAEEVARLASRKALLRRTGVLRPSLAGTKPDPHALGFLIGRSAGQETWATVEDSMLLIGPPRAGKGLHIMVNAVLEAPGAVIATSTRPDTLAVTLRARQRIGPVAVFDPEGLAKGLPAGLRWSPVRGCEDAMTALIRGEGFASANTFGDVTDGAFWQGKTSVTIATLLHAAAIDGRDAGTLFRWSLSPTAAGEAVRILQNNPQAASYWDELLSSNVDADPKQRDSIWAGVSLAFKSLAAPGVLSAVSPSAGESFDPLPFLQDRGTLYLLATASGAGAAGPLVAAFIEDIVNAARTEAAKQTRARLDPPLLMALDEIGNLAPLPSLPQLMSEGGGTGITVLPVLQGLAQARQHWGEAKADTIWNSAIVKMILGGLTEVKTLGELKTILGEIDEQVQTVTIDHYGHRTIQTSPRKVPIFDEERIRTLPFGVGITLMRSGRPLVTDLRPWTNRPDAAQLNADRAEIESALIAAARTEAEAAKWRGIGLAPE